MTITHAAWVHVITPVKPNIFLTLNHDKACLWGYKKKFQNYMAFKICSTYMFFSQRFETFYMALEEHHRRHILMTSSKIPFPKMRIWRDVAIQTGKPAIIPGWVFKKSGYNRTWGGEGSNGHRTSEKKQGINQYVDLKETRRCNRAK